MLGTLLWEPEEFAPSASAPPEVFRCKGVFQVAGSDQMHTLQGVRATYDLAAGDYVLLVRGRSRGLKIDRIILVHDEADEGAAKEAPETLYSSPPGTGGAGGTDPSGGAGAGPGSGSGSGSGGDDPVAAGSGGMGGDDGNGLDGGAEDDGGCTMGGAPAGDVPGSVALLALFGATAVIRRRR